MAEGGSGLNIHPMEQFEVQPLFGDGPVHWYTPTNATLWMALVVVARQPADGLRLARAGRWCPRAVQSIAELIYGFAYKMVEDVTGKEGLKYFPYIMTVFLFILFANLLALIPGSFALDLAHRGHGDPRARGLHHRHRDRLLQARQALPEALLGGERADGGAAHRPRA